MDNKSTIKLQAEEHEIINDDHFSTVEEYVLHLMHQSDYTRAQQLVSSKTVLDLGCNCGYGTNLLSQSCSSITGVDVSPVAIETAKKKYQRSNLTFTVVDGITLPFEDHTFDVVTSFQVVEHLVDYNTYFNEIRRVLKPDGLVILTTPNAAIRVKSGAKPWNRFHIHEFRGDELTKLLCAHFSHVKVFGQFATERAYMIEYNRCIAARDRMGTSSHPSLKSQLVNMLPDSLVNSLRILRASFNRRTPDSLTEQIMAQFSVEDFLYRTTDLDATLSLVACCACSYDALSRAIHTFIAEDRVH